MKRKPSLHLAVDNTKTEKILEEIAKLYETNANLLGEVQNNVTKIHRLYSLIEGNPS